MMVKHAVEKRKEEKTRTRGFTAKHVDLFEPKINNTAFHSFMCKIKSQETFSHTEIMICGECGFAAFWKEGK